MEEQERVLVTIRVLELSGVKEGESRSAAERSQILFSYTPLQQRDWPPLDFRKLDSLAI